MDILKPRTWLGVNNYYNHTNLRMCATQLLWFALLQIIIHQVYEKNTWILGLEPQLLCQEIAMRVYGFICQFSYPKRHKTQNSQISTYTHSDGKFLFSRFYFNCIWDIYFNCICRTSAELLCPFSLVSSFYRWDDQFTKEKMTSQSNTVSSEYQHLLSHLSLLNC